MAKGCSIMGYDSIRIERDRSSFCVTVTDPEIVKRNRSSDNSNSPSPWTDPNVEYNFDDKAAVLKFLDAAMDIALPPDTYTSAFDKLAKEAGGTPDE
jgi:hypothetical protein